MNRNSNIVQIQTNPSYDTSVEEYDTEKSQTNLIINYIPQLMTNDEFVNIFKSIGQLKTCKIIRDKITGNSFGFGFAEYYDPLHAKQAVELLNGTEIRDKRIKVAFAKALSQIKSGNLYVRFLPTDYTDKEIRQIFEPYGTISTCRILKNDQGRSRGVAFVLYDREESARKAMENLDDTILGENDQKISVKFADDAKQKQKFNSAQNRRGGSGGGGGGGGGGDNNSIQNNNAQQNNYQMQQQMQIQNQMLIQQQALFHQLQQQMAGASGAGPIRNSRNSNRYNPMSGEGGNGMDGNGMDGGNNGMEGGNNQIQNQLGQMNNMAQLMTSLMGNNQMNFNQSGNMMGNMMQQQTQQQNQQQQNNFSQFERTAKNKDGYTLFVYNTGPECTEDQLRTLFSQYGKLNKVAMMKDDSGKSRGFAFVSLPMFENACSAINGLNGYMLMNGNNSNKLQVSFKVKK